MPINITRSSFDETAIKSIVDNLSFAQIPLLEEWMSTASVKDRFLMHCTIIEISIIKKIVRYDSILECVDETNDLGFEEPDWAYLESEIEN